MLNRRLHRLVWVYTCQAATLLAITCRGSIDISGRCNETEYKCDNNRCINEDLKCNGFNPCGDYSDCKSDEEKQDAVQYAGFAGVFVIMVLACHCLHSPRARQARTHCCEASSDCCNKFVSACSIDGLTSTWKRVKTRLRRCCFSFRTSRRTGNGQVKLSINLQDLNRWTKFWYFLLVSPEPSLPTYTKYGCW